MKVLCTARGSGSDELDLLLITTPRGGTIYPISPSSKRDVSAIRSTNTVHELLIYEDLSHDMLMIPPRWASCVMELLQTVRYILALMTMSRNTPQELDRGRISNRKRCLKHLRVLARHFGELPLSFHLRGVAQESTQPLCGGGFAVSFNTYLKLKSLILYQDIWKGRFGGELVCIKVLRFFPATSIKEKIFKASC
jgi:hypothetical protein